MALTPGALGRRYAPFIAVAAVQVLLVAIVPSKVAKQSNEVAAVGGNGANAAAGASGGSVEGGSGAVGANGEATGAAGGMTGAGGSGSAAAGGGGTGAGDVSGAGGGASVAGGDRRNCDANGYQIGPSEYMPPCQPVFTGDNAGATMTGVTATDIRYVYYVSKSDPQVNAILQTQGLAASRPDQCNAWA